MFTPTRIRGKKGRARSHPSQKANGISASATQPANLLKDLLSKSPDQELAKVWSNPLTMKTSVIAEALSQSTPRLSALERLPTELIQQIFLLSLNLNLPQASAHIGLSLSATHLKKELVIQAFAGEIPRHRGGSGRPEVLRGQHLPVSDLQSALLRQKWLTFSFFRHCQKIWMLRHAIQEYRSCCSGISQDVQASTLSRMTAFFDYFFDREARLRQTLKSWPAYLEPEKPAHGVFEWTDGNGIRCSISLDSNYPRMDIELDKDLDENKAEKLSLLEPRKGYLFPGAGLRCIIPEKLLHGPWTNERGHFLNLLLKSDAFIDWIDSTSGEVAERGLEDAIREENPVALRLLVPILPPQRGRAFPGLCSLPDRNLDDTEIEEAIAPLGKWTFTPRADYSLLDMDCDSLYVLPTTKHLRIAVIEKGCNLTILSGLLGMAAETSIDCDAPDIIQWALQQEAIDAVQSEDGTKSAPGKGRILLDMLAQERRKQQVSLKILEKHRSRYVGWAHRTIQQRMPLQ